MNIECATVGNWTLQLGRVQLMATTERLLPREVAPMLERERYTFGAERSTCWKLAAFGRRFIVEVIRRDR